MASEIHQLVKEKIKQSNQEVIDLVITNLVNEEILKRRDLLLLALSFQEKTKKEADKIKPDQIIYSEHGAEISSGYSKNLLETKKKTTELLTKITNAIGAAIADGNYDPLKNMSNLLIPGKPKD